MKIYLKFIFFITKLKLIIGGIIPTKRINYFVTFVTIFTFTALLFTYVGCNEDLELNKPNALSIDAEFHSISLLKSSNKQYQQINDAIEDFALIVAHSLQDREFREFYKSEAMKKFDGDFDILYSNVKDSYVGGKSLHARISEIANDIKKSHESNFKTEFSSVDELISKVPKLQIAIPVNCEEWNTSNFIPPVACLNSEMRNKAVTHIKAYERDGKLKMMDKVVTPKHTAIVISINERLDENGNVRECYLKKNEMIANIDYNFGNTMSTPFVSPIYVGDQVTQVQLMALNQVVMKQVGVVQVEKVMSLEVIQCLD